MPKLETKIGNGAISELLNNEIERVMKNIVDPSTKAKTVREITLKLKFKPGEDRDFSNIEIAVSSKTAPVKPYETLISIGVDDNGEPIYSENNPSKQLSIFADDNDDDNDDQEEAEPTNVIRMKGGR